MSEHNEVSEVEATSHHVHAWKPSHSSEVFKDPVLPITPQGTPGTCGCGGAAPVAQTPGNELKRPTYVYSIGRMQARFPNLSTEKEFAQVTARTGTAGQTDQQVFSNILSAPENRYLARQMNWVFTIQEVDSYLIVLRDPTDMDVLVRALRASPSTTDMDVIVGVMGPIAPATFANGLLAPIVLCDQMYSFDRAMLLQAIPKPKETTKEQFRAAAEDILNRVMLVSDNAGATDEHRALNYLAVRYPAIYTKASDAFGQNFSLTDVDVQPAALTSTRNMVDVVFSYTNRSTDYTESYFVRVDVTEEFPFLVTKLSPYYSRGS